MITGEVVTSASSSEQSSESCSGGKFVIKIKIKTRTKIKIKYIFKGQNKDIYEN